jgi:hypothetical protein
VFGLGRSFDSDQQQLLGAFDAVLHADAVVQALGLAQMDERAAQDDGAVLDRHVLGGAQLLDADGLEQLGADLIVDVEAGCQGVGGVEHGLVEPLARVLRPCGGIGDFLDDDRGHVALVAAGHLDPVAQQEGHEVERLAIGPDIDQPDHAGGHDIGGGAAAYARVGGDHAFDPGLVLGQHRALGLDLAVDRADFFQAAQVVGEAQRDLRGGALRRGGQRPANGGPAAGAGWPVAAGTPREGTGAAVMVWAASVRSRLRRARLMGNVSFSGGSQGGGAPDQAPGFLPITTFSTRAVRP